MILLLPCHEKWSLYLLENGMPDTHPRSTLAVIIKNKITVDIGVHLFKLGIQRPSRPYHKLPECLIIIFNLRTCVTLIIKNCRKNSTHKTSINSNSLIIGHVRFQQIYKMWPQKEYHMIKIILTGNNLKNLLDPGGIYLLDW